MKSDLCVFTTGESEESLALLRQSCERVGIELQTFGMGQWKDRGYAKNKIEAAREFLKTRTEYYAMFVDGHDSFILGPESLILKKLGSDGLQNHVRISAEKTCWPDATLAGRYHESLTPWRFLNAGGWGGNRVTLIQALSEIGQYKNQWPEDDQRCWTEWYLSGGNALPDVWCEVFQTMGGTDEMIKEGMAVGVNRVTMTSPLVWHFNGRTPGREEWYERLTGDRIK